ncbi:hypothetical protein E4L96_11775 [Massilia arenosa]|uniref:Uncharacterized protein n=1 Tax=Zemynaea arenosa TaxID=2561931 RepID=A0A4Y9SBC2_9BURK|nr:hypothetical protein [Massilia arenosa]TFW19430.1 hypothetical protein E4L96_11775 [Massilia arenosa]
MATEQQPEGLDPTLPDNLDQDGLDRAGAARRRFAKAGLGASGVLMTLASQPGMATELVCRAPSGYLSGKLTSQKIDNLVCVGRSPGYWKNCASSSWPANCTKATRFKDIFYCGGGYTKVPYASKFLLNTTTCGLLLDPQTWDVNKVANHIIAAYLNARTGKTSFLTADQVRAIWKEYWMTGVYKVNATVTWNGAQLVDYLTRTQG